MLVGGSAFITKIAINAHRLMVLGTIVHRTATLIAHEATGMCHIVVRQMIATFEATGLLVAFVATIPIVAKATIVTTATELLVATLKTTELLVATFAATERLVATLGATFVATLKATELLVATKVAKATFEATLTRRRGKWHG